MTNSSTKKHWQTLRELGDAKNIQDSFSSFKTQSVKYSDDHLEDEVINSFQTCDECDRWFTWIVGQKESWSINQ